MHMLPGRTWKAIREKGLHLGLSRKVGIPGGGKAYTPEEDELIRRYYAREISQDEVTSTGRSLDAIRTEQGL